MTRQTLIDGWKRLLAGLSVRQRILLLTAAVLIGAGLSAFSRWNRESDFKPLYTGMAAEDAGAVLEKLKQSGAEYRVADNGATILVPSSRQSELRLTMAAAGLPKTGRIGFELFDKTNLGATDFAEQINYRRALEGELERTIKSVAEIELARVHLTFPKDSVFLENRLPAKASVLLKARPTAVVTAHNVTAIAHLVASAVEGLAPDAVSVMDIHGNLLSRPVRSGEGAESSEAAIEFRQKVERDLLTKINSTLEPLLGAEKYRAGISVDCDLTSGEQSEETYDPERSVMLNSQKSEDITNAASSGGVPGVASNLPRAPARSGPGGGMTRRTETIAYQASKTIRRVRLPQGSIKRISASILLDQTVRWEGKPGNLQRVLTPPSPESVRAIREVVAGAIGFVPARGDQLIIETLPFESTLQTRAPAATGEPAVPKRGDRTWEWHPNALNAASGSAVLLLLGLAWYGYRRKKRIKTNMVMNAAVSGSVAAQDRALDGQAVESAPALEEPDMDERFKTLGNSRMQTLLTDLRNSIDEDPALAARVLRSWLEG